MYKRSGVQSLPTLKIDWCLGLMIKSYHQKRTPYVETLSKKKKKKNSYQSAKEVFLIFMRFLFFLSTFHFLNSCSSFSTQPLCNDSERLALLQFKQIFVTKMSVHRGTMGKQMIAVHGTSLLEISKYIIWVTRLLAYNVGY